ncbi:hypothetical protein TNCV_4615921 [Trichonephila clavipes]|nr:hypothetical protein TNCV_4615921 [Trichonephila clavipes]
MPSPVQFNCDNHDTIANGQYGAVWSMGDTQQVCVRIVFLPSNVWQQFFGRSAFLRQQETDLPPAELWTATAGSDVVQSGRPIFDDFFQYLWPYSGNNTVNVVFQMVKRLWLIRIDQ